MITKLQFLDSKSVGFKGLLRGLIAIALIASFDSIWLTSAYNGVYKTPLSSMKPELVPKVRKYISIIICINRLCKRTA